MKDEDIKKGFKNLAKLQKKYQEVKEKLLTYESKEVARAWLKLGVTDKEARHVISILEVKLL